MGEYSNWSSLVKAAQTACNDVLKSEVADTAKKIVNKHIQSDIYDTYSPVGEENGGYDRRNELGDPTNTISRMIDKNTILITNEAPPSPPIFDGDYGEYDDELLYWIEKGRVLNMFNNKDYPWMHPRPAISNAQEEINSSTEIESAIN